MLLLNHHQKAVSSMTAGTEGVSYKATSSSGSNQVQQQTLLTIPDTACFDMTLGNRLDLNICMVLDVLRESYDKGCISIHSKRTEQIQNTWLSL